MTAEELAGYAAILTAIFLGFAKILHEFRKMLNGQATARHNEHMNVLNKIDDGVQKLTTTMQLRPCLTEWDKKTERRRRPRADATETAL